MTSRRRTRSHPISGLLHRFSAIPARVFGFQVVTIAIVVMVVFALFVSSAPTAPDANALPVGTRIAGVKVGQMSPTDAQRALVSKTEGVQQRQFIVQVLDQELSFTAGEMGIVADPSASVQRAMLGHGGDYPLVLKLDPVQFERHIETLQSHIPSAGQNASVVITGSEVSVQPHQNGQGFDVSVYGDQLLSATGDEPSRIQLEITDRQPGITTEEAEVAAESVRTMIANPLVYVSGDEEWEVSPEILAAAVIVVPNQTGGLSIAWDIDHLLPMIDGIIAEIEATEPKDAWVQDLGTHSWLVPEQSAARVDRRLMIDNTNTALAGNERTVNVPVSIVAATKTSEDVMAELGITGVIARGDSVYDGSGAGRAHNVETSAYYIDRTLVPPGGVFSFNDSVGSLFTGEYMSAGSYMDGPNGQSIAGGVCQTSTTVFRAALNAGFPIEERWPHSYRTVFYEMGGWSPGYDAAIVQDSGAPEEATDLRFRNTTDSWIMVTAVTDGGRLTIEIWGEETGWEVSFSEPDQWVTYWAPQDVTVLIDDQLPAGTLNWQEAMDGLSVVFNRYVYDANGELLFADTWETTYYATGPIIRASPDMEEQAWLKAG